MDKSEEFVVCVLNDDASQLRVTNNILSEAGWPTRPFTDPDTFLEYARAHSPDVAILDFGGAHGRGLQIRSRLRDVSPKTWTVLGLTPHHSPTRRLRPRNELVDLIKQYVRASQKRLFSQPSLPPRREAAVASHA